MIGFLCYRKCWRKHMDINALSGMKTDVNEEKKTVNLRISAPRTLTSDRVSKNGHFPLRIIRNSFLCPICWLFYLKLRIYYGCLGFSSFSFGNDNQPTILPTIHPALSPILMLGSSKINSMIHYLFMLKTIWTVKNCCGQTYILGRLTVASGVCQLRLRLTPS